MKYQTANKAVSSFFSLMVFSIFAISSLLLVMIGANAYQTIVSTIEENNEIRASLSYVGNKVRQNDEQNAINTELINGIQTLTINQTIEEEQYITYIYHYNGNVCELFLKSDGSFHPEDGTKIVNAKSFFATKQDDMIILNVGDIDEDTIEYKLNLKSE